MYPDGDFLAIFCVLYFSEPRAAHFRHAFYIGTKATNSSEMQIKIMQNALYTVSQKTSYLWFAITLTYVNAF